MSVLRSLRALILGETWTLPLGVAVLIGAGALAHHLAPHAWHAVGGPALALGVAVLLAMAVAAGARAPRRRGGQSS